MDGSDGSPLPPLYPAVWETALALDLFGRGGLPFPSGGIVHTGGETVRLRPLKVGESIRCRVELAVAEAAPKGTRLVLACRSWNAAGMLCAEDTVELLTRTGRGGGAGRRRSREPAESERTWSTLDEWAMAAGDGWRYARASGDYNPIHLWSWSSRLLGFDRPILHGFCIQAMVAHALIRQRLGGEPDALRRLSISFRAPISLPSRVRLLVSEEPGGRRFRVELPESGRSVAEGAWVGAAQG